MKTLILGIGMPVTRVNNGDPFGFRNATRWYTFYCPNQECKRQLILKNNCPHCNQIIDWTLK